MLTILTLFATSLFGNTLAQSLCNPPCEQGYGCVLLLGKCLKEVGQCVDGICEPNVFCFASEEYPNGACYDIMPETTSAATSTAAAATVAPNTTACVDLASPGKPSDCPQNAHLCNDPLYYGLMTKQCPKTCGRCPGSSTDTCVDLAPPGKPSDCPQNAHLCNDPLYYDLMTKQCPKTCGRCPGAATTTTPCVDLSEPGKPSDCSQNAHLCNNPLYYDLMTKQCPKTCGRC